MIQNMYTSMRHYLPSFFIGIILYESFLTLAVAQRVAPGVSPQHYQQNPHDQQFQQPPPPQYQQQNAQYQQYQHQATHQQQQQFQQPPPQQQQHQQQQFQQQPPQQHQQQHQQHPPQQPSGQAGHGHHGGHGGGVLNSNVADERDHIKEHMEVPIDTSKMTEQELQFHYFTMHDSDKNNKLDGSELIKSLIHWHDDDEKATKQERTFYSDEQLTETIDFLLKSMDTNGDGYIDYTEYKMNSD